MAKPCKVTSDLTAKTYTGSEFARAMEKRLRKHLRLHDRIDLDRTYVISATANGYASLLQRLLESIFKDRIRILPASEADKSSALLLARPLEEHVSTYLDYFLENKDVSSLEPEAPNPLKIMTVKECTQLALIYEIPESLETTTNPLIERMHDHYPQTKSSLLKSIDAIQRKLESPTDLRD